MDEIELLRQRLNWMYDYKYGNTTVVPPSDWNWNVMQQNYFELTGFKWDAQSATNIEVMPLVELVRLVNAWMMYPIYIADYEYTIGTYIDMMIEKNLSARQVLHELGIGIDEAIMILQDWK